MAFDNRDSIDFGKGQIPKLFAGMFIPTLIGLVADLTYILADGIFVGMGVGAGGLAAINMIMPVMMLLTGIGVMFGMGGSVVAAIHMSRDNIKAARINITLAFEAASFIALVLIIVLYCLPDRIIPLLGASEELFDMTKEYYTWFLPVSFFLMIQIIGCFIIRLDGSPIFAMVATIVPSIINIFLDYFFIFICGYGVMGAALATDIGYFSSMMMIVFYMLFRARHLKLYRIKMTLTSLRLCIRNVGYMIKVGFSGLIGELSTSVLTLAGNLSFAKYLGDIGLEAFSTVCYLLPIVFNVYIAISSSSQPIISFNFGAGNTERVDRTFRYGLTVGSIFALSVTLLFWLFSPAVVSIFLERGSDVFDVASKGLPIIATGFIFMAFNFSAIGYFQSTEKNFCSTLLTILRGFVFVIGSFIVLPIIMGTTGLWLAAPVTEALTSLTGIILFFAQRKRSIR